MTGSAWALPSSPLREESMAKWKGIVLAGGSGSRLFPLTYAVNKHLLPVYDKPMIYYPLTTLMLGGLRDFIIISSPEALNQICTLLGDGTRWGISISYRVQERAGGIAECFRIAAEDIADCNVALVLGDNIFYGAGLPRLLSQAMDHERGATIFGYEVADPSGFGVVDLEEKPQTMRSRFAVPGLYFYDERVVSVSNEIRPSARGELEITDVNRYYLKAGDLRVRLFGRGVAWLDGGTHQDLFEASQFVKVIEERTGLKIACPEEVAWRMKFIDQAAFEELIDAKPKTEYQRYLRSLLEASSLIPDSDCLDGDVATNGRGRKSDC
jgi:glucose-1-phosphate thymidylyltransferase